MGRVRFLQGDFESAISQFRAALTAQPNESHFRFDLAVALHKAGRPEEAVATYRVCLRTMTNNPQPLLHLGEALSQLGRLEEAVTSFRKAAELSPQDVTLWSRLGKLLHRIGDHTGARSTWQQAVTLEPNNPRHWLALGKVWFQQRDWSQAEDCYRTGWHRNPQSSQLLSRLGLVLWEQNRLTEAEECLRQAVELPPPVIEAERQLAAFCIYQTHQFKEGLSLLRRRLDRDPNSVTAHSDMAEAFLVTGHWREGWSEYEWRSHSPRFQQVVPRKPLWTGQALAGQTLLLVAEQGFGDTIQFIRFASVLTERGARVILGCPQPLVPLMQSVSCLTAAADREGELPDYDLWASLHSLPWLLEVTEANLPAKVPYVNAPKPVRTIPSSGCRKIGIVWAGNPKHPNDAHRSCPLSHWQPLFDLPDTTFVNLQVGANQTDFQAHFANRTNGVDTAQAFTDFADTASVVAQLDLVITVDTAVAHLAGALGKPVWVMLPLNCDWRWLLQREDTPWYPTMRLFRQSRRGDWTDVIHRIRTALTSS